MKLKTYLSWICQIPVNMLSLMAPKNTVGGQAILEGVMMRGKENVSWAVRKNTDEIVVEQFPFSSVCKKYRILARPILRGAVNLYESMVLGYRALTRSADILEDSGKTENDSNSKSNNLKEKFYTIITLLISLLFALGLFMFAPMWIFSHFIPKESALLFNTLAGALRILLMLMYMISISFFKDIRRLFEYHGAEHKAIFTFEDGKELNFENMRCYSRVHPRCGTSFLLLVGIICVFLFSIIDALFIQLIGPFPNVFSRFLLHILLIPLVGGTSYEVLKLSDRYQHIALVNLFIMPGLWLQKITTREPDEKQMEVASLALRAVI
ncbi:MAG: DUF1385 domain-containing protein [Fibrobacter sp.]|jgi:uncharacterized protein YqhQ|nr:DUF1385 domain-containing protein [Fibrobacter sp.]